MTDAPVGKPYDLLPRTRIFAKKVRALVKALPPPSAKSNDARQLIRSSGSVGANFIEAAEALSPKDRLMRMKICRKESKESAYWLDLLDCGESEGLTNVRKSLLDEALQLTRIFGKIVHNAERESSGT